MTKDFKNKFSSKLKSIVNVEFLDDSQSSSKIPFWELSLLPLGVLVYRFKRFLYLSFIYAVLIAILAFATRTNYVCGYSEWKDNPYFSCSASVGLYICFFLIRLLLVSVFLRVWYKTAVCGQPVTPRELFVISYQDWKIFGNILAVIGVLSLPIIGFYLLYDRVPNPDWRIESLYFAVVAAIISVPLVATVFWGKVANCLMTEKTTLSLKEVWKRARGSNLKIIMSLFLLLTLDLILFTNLTKFSFMMLNHNILLGGIAASVLYNMFLLLMFSAFAANSIVLKTYIEGMPAEPQSEEKKIAE